MRYGYEIMDLPTSISRAFYEHYVKSLAMPITSQEAAHLFTVNCFIRIREGKNVPACECGQAIYMKHNRYCLCPWAHAPSWGYLPTPRYDLPDRWTKRDTILEAFYEKPTYEGARYGVGYDLACKLSQRVLDIQSRCRFTGCFENHRRTSRVSKSST